MEMGLRYVESWGSIKASYSFSTVTRNTASLYDSDFLGDDSLIGMPAHMVSVLAVWNPIDNFFIDAEFNFIGQTSGYRVTGDATGDYMGRYGPSYLLGIGLRYENLLIEGLEGRFAVHDLLNEAPVFVQPYRGGGPPLPGASREYTMSLVYAF